MFLCRPSKIAITVTGQGLFAQTPGMVPIEKVPDYWYLDGPLVWQDDNDRIVIPKGFVTDDASIPKPLDWIKFLDRQGLSRLPGLLHDGLYSLGRTRGKDFADDLLRRACIAEGMSAAQAGLIYQGVHLFGASSYAADGRLPPWSMVDHGDFFTQADYDAWVASGATIYFKPETKPGIS